MILLSYVVEESHYAHGPRAPNPTLWNEFRDVSSINYQVAAWSEVSQYESILSGLAGMTIKLQAFMMGNNRVMDLAASCW